MLTGKALFHSLLIQLNETGLTGMSATLDEMYRSPSFTELDPLMTIANLVEPEYQKKMNKRIQSRLHSAHLHGCPQELCDCIDSTHREYLPRGITETLSTFDFIDSGLNICILGLAALKAQNYIKYQKRLKKICGSALLILNVFLLHTITREQEVKILFEILEKRCEMNLSTIICSQREPASWSAMILNEEVSANAILKRATKHYTLMIKPQITD